MPKEETIAGDVRVKFRGIFDLSLIYANLRNWLTDMGYGDPVKREIKYVEKVKPGGKDIEIVWKTSKEEEDGFFKLNIGIKIYVTKVNDVEIDKEDQKLKLQKGDLLVNFDSNIILNANEKWKERSFRYKIYETYLVGDKTEQYKINLYDDTYNMVSELKNFLNIYQ